MEKISILDNNSSSDSFSNLLFNKLRSNIKNSNNNNHKYPLQSLTLDFEFELYKEFTNFKFDKINNNISLEEYNTLKIFLKNKPFKITECDKNIGVAIVSNQVYEELSFIHLDNKENFIKLDENPLNEVNTIVLDTLISLKNNKHISKRLYNNLFIKEPKLGKFRILMKLHKSKFGTRPIINCKSCPTVNLAIFVDTILQVWVRLADSFLQDTQHLLQLTYKFHLNENNQIYSLDFSDLYSNINLEHALDTICDFMRDKLSLKTHHADIIGFYQILKLILFNNVFTFNEFYFKQIKGVAMGCKCAPSVANVYLYVLEQNFLIVHKPLFYKRYIDDIFCITKKEFDINILVNNFDYLKLNLEKSNNVNFLDMTISYDKSLNKLNFVKYFKPTQSFSYLFTNSNHAGSIFKNIPLSLFINIKRTCSKFSDFLFICNDLINRLEKRGYDLYTLHKIKNTVSKMDRLELINYKDKKDFTISAKEIVLSFEFDLNLLNINKIFNNCIKNIYNDNFYNFVFKKCNKFLPNISSLLIHNIYSYNYHPNSCKYYNCNNLNCKICSFSLNYKYLLLNNNFYLPIFNNSNCKSSHFIYIILCEKCNCFYIGQSYRTVEKRLIEHINNIKKFICYEKYNTVVSIHFNLKGHTLKHFKFIIIANNIIDDNLRLHIEAKYINLFLQLNQKILNDHTPYIYNNINKIYV